MAATSDEGNAAYNAGRCKTCLTAPLSPGRTRCEDCHHTYIRNPEAMN